MADARNRDAAQELHEKYGELVRGIGTRIVGLDRVIENLLVALFSGGHCLLTGVPGLAKTLLISTLADLLSLKFRRIQFTPDLMPADITGTEVITEDRESGERSFRFLPGPIFANIILADEINRTPPKTQAALLEAMEEKQVTSVGRRHGLELPFFVLATQNPIEQEGTYALPAAQLDRFMMSISVGYPSEDEEYRIVRKTVSGPLVELRPVLTREKILNLISIVRTLAVPDDVMEMAIRMVRATRPRTENAEEFSREWLEWGAGPRAVQSLVIGARARGLLLGRTLPGTEDLWAIANPILSHRLIPSFQAEALRVTTDQIIERLKAKVLELPDESESTGIRALIRRWTARWTGKSP